MSARARATERTRTDIVEAAAALLRDEHPASLTVPSVAERAGVSVRTVYRHFPTKSDLVDATAGRFLERIGVARAPRTTAELRTHLASLWPVFDADRDAVRAEHVSPAGRQLRGRRLEHARESVRDAVGAEAPALDDADRDRLVDLVIALSSSAMFLELVDRLGRDASDAADTAAWAIDTLIHHAHATGRIRP